MQSSSSGEYFAHSGKSPDGSDWQRLPDHHDRAARLAAASGQHVGLPLCAGMAARFHDFGKYDPAFQRRGLGRQLLQHLIDELIKRDVLTLWLEVRASNLPAIALYEQLGFNQVSRRPNYYPTASGREDAILMALTP